MKTIHKLAITAGMASILAVVATAQKVQIKV